MIGGLQLSSCCSNPVPNEDVPSCPVTTITCNYIERQTFNATYLPVPYSTFTSNHPGCSYPSTISTWQSPISSILGDWVCSTVINGVATAQATWTATSSTITNATNGAILRPGTNTVIATANYRYKTTTFSLSTRTRTATGPLVVSGTVTRQGTGMSFTCCEPESSTIFVFDILSQGPPVTNPTPTAVLNHTIRWVGICNQKVVGLTLVRTSTSPSSNPWKIQVAGGELRLIDKDGNVTAYSGPLTAVRNSINAAGLFTATLGSVTSAATTADLLPMSPDYALFGCNKQVLVADVGWPIAPGLPLGGGITGQVQVSTGSYIEYFDSTSSGFPNNESGALSWLNRPRNPKIVSVASQGFFQSDSFNYLGLSSRWIGVPGESSITLNVVLQAFPPDQGGDFREDVVSTIVCTDCYTGIGGDLFDCDPCPLDSFGVSPPYGTVNFCPDRYEQGFFDCFGNIVQDICGYSCSFNTVPRAFAACVSTTSTISPILTEDILYPLVQRIEGSFNFS